MTIAKMLYLYRVKNGLNQVQLSSRLRISQAFYSQIESGAKQPSSKVLSSISDELEIPVQVLQLLTMNITEVPAERREVVSQLIDAVKPLVEMYFPNASQFKLPTKLEHLANICGLKGDAEELRSIADSCTTRSNHHYREFVTNKSIKRRYVQSPVDKLKYVQKCLTENLLNHIEIHDAAYGGVKGRDNLANALVHVDNRFFFNTDISSFYPSINHRHVYASLTNVGFIPDIARVITQLTTYAGMIPTGASSSVAIANIVMLELDRAISAITTKHNLDYTRFVDDIAISGNTDFRDNGIVDHIIKLIHDYGYRTHNRKTFYTDIQTGSSVLITGVDIDAKGIRPSRNIRKKIKGVDTPQGLINYVKRFSVFAK